MKNAINDRKELVVIFDGVCNLCNRSVQFIIKYDKKNKFKFASLQSNFGQNILIKNNMSITNFNSFLLLEGQKIYTRSTGALRVVKQLDSLWPTLYALIIIPPFIRNALYSWIANNRYIWFGKKDTCLLPTPDLKERFFL